jgi:uncharacterized membrane protein
MSRAQAERAPCSEGEHMRRHRTLSLLLLVAVLLITALPASAQSKTLVWDRYDVFLNILPNGDVRVTERQEINFGNGPFTYGYAVIPLDKTASIVDVAVSDATGRTYQQTDYSIEPYTFWANQNGNELEIRWYFPSVENDTRTFDLSYTAKGAIRIYDSGDKLQWIAIDNERDFPINEATVSVSLPEGASFLDIDSSGVSADWEQGDGGRTVQFVARHPMSASDRFEIGVEFTHGIVPANAPAWQAEVDRQESFDRNVRPVLNLAVGALAILIALGGPLLVYLLWYTRGRDPNIGPVPDTLSQPPDDLPPGVLGSLVDEQADMQDIVATIVDLARRGYLKIEEVEEKGFFGLGSTDFVFRKTDKSEEDLRRYEKRIMSGIFPGSRQERELSSLRNKFYKHLPKIQEDLYKELVDNGLFKRRPDKTRAAWTGIGIVALVLTFVLGIFLVPLAQYAGAFPCLAASLGVGGIALLIAGRFMPVKTVKGAESAAKWNAFKSYLAQIDKMSDMKNAAEMFEHYLPYAIAFGMNQSYVGKFARMTDTPAPGWYIPYFPRGGAVGGGGGGGLAKRTGAGAGAPGGLQGMSDSLSGGLQSMSDGLTTMLNSTGRVLRSAPSSSGSSGGGGFSGGGFSGGGGGGGGGRGFG